MAEPLDEALYALKIRERLATAYAAAMHAQHAGGRVEIHLGSDITAHLKKLIEEAMGDDANFLPAATIWGFPVVDSTAAPDHMSVHTVHTIA